jgi:ABC-type multidrug transport system permease subunit
MILEIFNYSNSFLNPALKLLVPLIFLCGIYYAERAMRRYTGEIRKLMRALTILGTVGFLANLFRYMADAIAVSWKWGESIAMLAFVMVSLYAALYAAGPLARFVRQLLHGETATGGGK